MQVVFFVFLTKGFHKQKWKDNATLGYILVG